MILDTHRPVSGTIRIYVNGEPVDIEEARARVRLQPGHNTFFMKLPVDLPGVQTFEAVFRPDDETMDTIALNNTARGFTFVSGSSYVLLLSKDPAA